MLALLDTIAHALRRLDDPARRRHALLAVLVVGAVLRLWFAVDVLPTQLATVPYLDAQEYDQWARDLVAGDWGEGEPYWMGPLYPHLLALSYAVFGVGSVAVLVLQLALSLLNLWLIDRLARHWLGPRWSLLATVLYAGYGPPVFYAGLKLMVTLVTSLLLLTVWQLQRASTAPTRGRWFVLGLLVGLCALARGNVLGLVPLLPLVLWRRIDVGTRGAWRLAAWLWLGAAVMIAPVTVRNVLVGHDAVLLTSNGGVNLLIGQQTRYGGRFGPLLETPQYEFDPSGRQQLEVELARSLRPSQVSRELTRRAWRRVLAEPGGMVSHYGRKVYGFWNGYEVPQIYSWNFWRHRVSALDWLPVDAAWLLALGLAGAMGLRPDARRAWFLVVGGWFLTLVPFFPTSRYRQPIMGLLAVGAAAWLAAVVTRWRDGRRRQSVWLVTVAMLLLLLLWPPWSRLDPAEEFWHCQLNRATRAAMVGDEATLDEAVNAAEAIRPGLAETSYRHGGYLEKAGNTEAALAAYRNAARRAPEHPFVLYRVARTLTELDRHAEALIWYDRAEAADPQWAFPHHGRALSLRALGRLDDAVAAWQRAVALEPGRTRYRSNLASALAVAGREPEALVILQELVRDFPAYVPGWFNLALAEARLGRNEAARQTLERAAALPGVTSSQRASIDALRRELARRP